MADLSKPQKLNGAYYYPNAYPVGENRKAPPPPRRQSYQSSSSRGRIGFCCKCFCSVLLAIILILGIASLVIWLVYRPKLPRYSVQDVKIQTLNLTSSPRAIDSDIVLTIQARNPNKKIGIKYQSINTQLWFAGTQLGSNSIPAFYQGRRNVTLLRTELKGSKVPVSQSTATGLKSAMDKNSILLNTRTTVKAKIKMGKLTSMSFKVRVRCALRVSSPSASGGAKLLSRNCKVTRGKFW